MAFFDMENKEYECSIRTKVLDAVNVPKDVAPGLSLLTVYGKTEVIIENYTGIIEYTECMIRMRTKGAQIRIEGKALHIEYYAADEMKIIGSISCITFL